MAAFGRLNPAALALCGAGVLCLLLLAGACGGGSSYGPSNQPTAYETPLPTSTPEPLSQEDAAKVNAVVEALQTKDIAKIRPHVAFRKIACVAYPSDAGAPKCQGDEQDGQQIDAFYFATCEGAYVRPADIDASLQVLTQTDVYRAYRRPRTGDSPYEYSVVLVDHAPERASYAWDAVIDNGELIGLLFSCSLSPEDLIKARHYTVVVPAPRAPAAVPGT